MKFYCLPYHHRPRYHTAEIEARRQKKNTKMKGRERERRKKYVKMMLL